jgi:hypothetical protein
MIEQRLTLLNGLFKGPASKVHVEAVALSLLRWTTAGAKNGVIP